MFLGFGERLHTYFLFKYSFDVVNCHYFYFIIHCGQKTYLNVMNKEFYYILKKKFFPLISNPGNGPSAIALSFMLSGYRPYYNGATLSNEYLVQRLQDSADISLFEQVIIRMILSMQCRSHNFLQKFVLENL